MKNMTKLLALLLALTLLVGSLISCDGDVSDDTNTTDELVDYVGSVKFDENSGRVWCEATVKTDVRHGETVYTGCVDGDTTHFNVPSSIPTANGGILKARYIAINTPESTGQIEPWGKKASNFTKEKLINATSIILESDTNKWTHDSTGERTLVWVWYKTAGMTDYRNLNLEILQEGLAWASGYNDYVYADACRNTLSQAMAHKLYVHDKTVQDPDFYYGAAQLVTLKELKTNIEKYKGTTVAFEANVAKNLGSTVYVEEYDDETGEYFGMQVYCGFGLSAAGKNILKVGNRVVIAGSVQYYEAGDTYQISDIKYDPYDKENTANIKLVEKNYAQPSFDEATVSEIVNGELSVEVVTKDENDEEITETKKFDYGFLTMHSSKTLKDLTIVSIYTTSNGGDSDGAHSITCKDSAGNKIVLRTEVLYDETNHKLPASYFPIGAKIEVVSGIVGAYDGEYQLMVFHQDDVVLAK